MWRSATAAGLAASSRPLVDRGIIRRVFDSSDHAAMLATAARSLATSRLARRNGRCHAAVRSRMVQRVGQDQEMRDLHNVLFRSIQQQPISFSTQTQAGDVVQRLTGDLRFVQAVAL
jgi:ABC-type multidrug transport system fused ATPase/permease subunit